MAIKKIKTSVDFGIDPNELRELKKMPRNKLQEKLGRDKMLRQRLAAGRALLMCG